MRIDGRSFARAAVRFFLAAATLLAFNCTSAREEPSGGETHFLQRCTAASGSCGPDLVCACGVCTQPCTESAACGEFPAAACVAPSEAATCATPGATYCDVSCSSDQDCSTLSPDHRCYDSACRRGGDSANACPNSATVNANEVVILGDSFFAADHRITAFLEDLARSHGSLMPGERYRDFSSSVANGLALAGTGITNQYVAALAESPVRVVVMTGGGADVLLGSCDVVSDACPLLVAAVTEAEALLQRMAADGVEQVVYTFYPDPTDAELRAKVDALRPLLEGACSRSSVACSFVDLRPAFDGHDDYLNAEGIFPTQEGARVAASEIWSFMSAGCIAQ